MFSSGIPDIEERIFFSSLFSVGQTKIFPGYKVRKSKIEIFRHDLPDIVISRKPPSVIVDGCHCLTNKHLSLASVYGCDVSSNSWRMTYG